MWFLYQASFLAGYASLLLNKTALILAYLAIFKSQMAMKLTLFQACDLVKRGGLLILSSPYTWKEEHTEVEKWIGGNYRDAEKCFTERGLEAIVRGRGLVLRED